MKQIKKVFGIFFAALFLCVFLCGDFTVCAEDSSDTVVRIGFPIQKGNSYINERGDYEGYLVDYLHQLMLFTDWDVEFVQVEGDPDTQLSTLMYMLLDGEIDIMGTMNRNAMLEDMFLYPNYSYGTTYTVLAVREDDLRWIEEDFSSWDSMRVATYPGYQERMERFDYYASVNDFSYTTVECESYQGMIEAVQNGEADAMIQTDVSMADGFRIIGRFSPAPYYFALAPDDSELLQQLNSAMRSLNSSQPNLQTELYDLYFRQTNHFRVSQEHLDYIRSLGTLKVLFFDGNAPYQYIKNGKLTGFAVEYLERFAEATGLQYEAVVADSYAEGLKMVSQGKIDLVACIATNSTLSTFKDMRFTVPFFNSFSVTACANPDPHEHPTDVEFQINTQSALNEIQKTKKGVQLDYYSLSYYLRKQNVYDNLMVDWANTKNYSYVICISSNISRGLVTILNQYISSVNDQTIQTMLYSYSGDEVEYTLWEWLLANRLTILVAVVLLLFMICVILLCFRSRQAAYKALLAENRFMHLAKYDEVTGAYNETYFRRMLDESCCKQEKNALVAFNIRGFKYINGIYGGKRADEMLCGIKQELDTEMEKGEYFCRPSADLFYMLLAESCADDLLTRLDAIFSKVRAEATLFFGWTAGFHLLWCRIFGRFPGALLCS